MRGGRVRFPGLLVMPSAALVLAVGSSFAADTLTRSAPRIVAKPASTISPPSARAATATERLLSDTRDGRLDDFTFLTAALIASGCETIEDAQKWLAMYEPVRAGILGKVPAGTAVERMQEIHAAAHRFVITGAYDESCSDLRKTFASGGFNCLTSLAVCYDLGRSAGLNVQPLLTRGHVSLSIQGGNGAARSFEPGAIEWSLRPVSDLAGSRSLSAVELLGKFYYNRGVELIRASRYPEGLALLRTSVSLDPGDDDARSNLVGGLNNWAAVECQRGRYEDAAVLIEQGLAIDPTFAPLVANEQFVRTKLAK